MVLRCSLTICGREVYLYFQLFKKNVMINYVFHIDLNYIKISKVVELNSVSLVVLKIIGYESREHHQTWLGNDFSESNSILLSFSDLKHNTT